MPSDFKDIANRISALFIDTNSKEPTCPIWLAGSYKGETVFKPDISARHRKWLETIDFHGKPGKWAFLPGDSGLDGVVAGADTAPLFPGSLPPILPKGDYHLGWDADEANLAATAWALGHYAFQTYQSSGNGGLKRLRLPEGADRSEVVNIAAASWLGRDLINIPANDLGPAELEQAARNVAGHFGADFSSTTGDDLLPANFPLIHAVGRASTREPRLIDMRWGDPNAPKVTLVGKGMCFDTGGLNIKPGAGMALMKKDMGGSAAALALAAMIMGAGLPVRLRLLIAAAENSISGNSFRPGDVLKSRAGLNVEIGDTDAEGRLVLADALALADEEAPDYLISFATLTGSARVALGPDLPPVYSTDSAIAGGLTEIGGRIGDPMWPMPLWQPYDQLLDSRIGDINSIFPEPFAGSIMAALFLNRFVNAARSYTHFDIYGWVPKPQPGKPFGGEPQCARAVFDYLKGICPKA
ncbi:MAG: M17 family metallopeptidase [Rhodomicrobiaceae bacterium]